MFDPRKWLFLAVAVSAVAVAAPKRPQEFQAPKQMTDEEIAEAKERSKSSLIRYSETMETKQKEFPYLYVGLLGLSILVAFPFAFRAYRRTSKEIVREEVARAAPRRRPASPTQN